MPLYDYKCPDCKRVFEMLTESSVKSAPCPKCQAESERLLTKSFTAHYKGAGFYSTDYKD